MIFKRSKHFWDMTALMKATLLFKDESPIFSTFLWLIFPITFTVWIAWVIGDICYGEESKL